MYHHVILYQGGSLWEHCGGWLQKVLGELLTIIASHKSVFLWSLWSKHRI